MINQDNQILLNRICLKNGYAIHNGYKKLLNEAIPWVTSNGFQEIIAFGDNRFADDDIYENMGFRLIERTDSDYTYVNLKRPIERFSKELFENSTLPENYSRIWDCGQSIWKLKI